MITKLDLSSHSVRKIVTQESLLKINFFHLSSKEQSLHSPSSGSSRLTQNTWTSLMMTLQKFYENIIPKIAYLLVANNLF